MKRLLAAGLVALALSHPAQAYFWDGNKLIAKMRQYEKSQRHDEDTNLDEAAFFMGFVSGVSDTLDEVAVCQPDGATVGQSCAVVVQYFNAHPEAWSEPAHVLVRRALRQAFPCKGTK